MVILFLSGAQARQVQLFFYVPLLYTIPVPYSFFVVDQVRRQLQ